MHPFQENPLKQEMNVKSIAACASDVGYFNVKYTKGRKNDGGDVEIACAMFPAVAPTVTANQLLHASGTPEADTCTVSVSGVNYVVGNGATAFTKGNEPRTVEPEYCTSDRYYALLLGALNYVAQHAGAQHEFVIDTLALGLPLNTYAQFAGGLAEKARGEHRIGKAGGPVLRRVTVNNVHIMVQPHGAMLNFGSRSAAEGATLVVDPGGGTLDWFLTDAEHNIAWARSGAYPRAMLHVAQAIADQIKEGLRNQIGAMNAIDKALRLRESSFMIGPRRYEMANFKPVVEAVLEQSVKAMLDRTGALDDVRRILLTGGGASIFRTYLEEKYEELKEAIEMDLDPVFSNVRGFQVAAEHIAESRGVHV